MIDQISIEVSPLLFGSVRLRMNVSYLFATRYFTILFIFQKSKLWSSAKMLNWPLNFMLFEFHRPEISQALKELVLKLLCKDPSKRISIDKIKVSF